MFKLKFNFKKKIKKFNYRDNKCYFIDQRKRKERY